MGRPFIAVDERMVLREVETVGGSFLLEGREVLLTAERLVGLSKSGFEGSQVPDAGGSAGLVQDGAVKFQNLVQV